MEYIKVAREAVAMYETIGEEEIVQIQDLLAVIIGTNKVTPELTGKLASRGLLGLMNLSVQDLEVNGLSHNDALKIHASLILAKKIAKTKKDNERLVVRSPDVIGNYLMAKMKYLKQEHLVAIYLNTKNVVIKEKTVFVGSLNASIVHPREVYAEAFRNAEGVASLIITHNHPSGDPAPSKEDIQVSKRLHEVGKMVGIELLDSLVIGDGRYVSLKEKGYL